MLSKNIFVVFVFYCFQLSRYRNIFFSTICSSFANIFAVMLTMFFCVRTIKYLQYHAFIQTWFPSTHHIRSAVPQYTVI